MEYLAELSSIERTTKASTPCLALTDGPLLWPYPERSTEDALVLQAYLDALIHMQQTNVVPVGYVDRPGGRTLLDLLWVSQLALEDVVNRCNDNPLRLLTDRALMAKVLSSGERSAWFRRLTSANRRHAGAGQEVWFCYVNLGASGRPMIARLEVPAWAAKKDATITTLHAALQHQVAALDGYPYVLARAHEEALITTKDKAALDSMIQQRLVARGILVQLSEKARQKSYLGRR